MANPKHRWIRSVTLGAFLALGAGSALVVDAVAPQHAEAQDVDIGFFYTGLAPHGEWFFQADFGWVWRPGRVSAGWRPYTAGQWVYANDYGWTWASQEPWGWATYHYGRWYFDPYNGWTWVPGRTWAPAWVSWRVESGYIGWAPLWPVFFDSHPDYRWDRWRHDDDWRDRHRDRDWDRWVFTRDRDFTSSNVGTVQIRDRGERDRLYRTSREVPIDQNRPESIGRGIEKSRIEKAVGRTVPVVRVENADQPNDRAEVRGDTVRMYRPRVKEAPADKTPDKLGVAKTPPAEERQKNTIRAEKDRLDSAPAKGGRGADAKEPADRQRGGGAPGGPDRDPATGADKNVDREPAPRDKNVERGGGAPDREPASGKKNLEQGTGSERQPTEREKKNADRNGGAGGGAQDREPANKNVERGGGQDRQPATRERPDSSPGGGPAVREPKPERAPQPAERPQQKKQVDRPAPQQREPQSQQREPQSQQREQVQPQQAPRPQAQPRDDGPSQQQPQMKQGGPGGDDRSGPPPTKQPGGPNAGGNKKPQDEQKGPN